METRIKVVLQGVHFSYYRRNSYPQGLETSADLEVKIIKRVTYAFALKNQINDVH